MSSSRGFLELLASMEPKNNGFLLKISDEEKRQIQEQANIGDVSMADYVRNAIYYYAWATSEIELSVNGTSKNPEFIDLVNSASYPIYLSNYLITDDTFDQSMTRTNKHRHSFHFSPLIFQYINGQLSDAVLHSGHIVRVYSKIAPDAPPPGISIWTSLNQDNKIWNDFIDRVTIYKIARKKSEDIIAGIPSKNFYGLNALTRRST